MESKVKIAGHSVHQMLIVFPLGLLATAIAFDILLAALVGGVLALVTGRLGGEFVGRLGVGVDDEAHLDSPSSLSKLPAGAGVGVIARAHAPSLAAWLGVERRVGSRPAYVGVECRSYLR
jgi:hypothetical protein